MTGRDVVRFELVVKLEIICPGRVGIDDEDALHVHCTTLGDVVGDMVEDGAFELRNVRIQPATQMECGAEECRPGPGEKP